MTPVSPAVTTQGTSLQLPRYPLVVQSSPAGVAAPPGQQQEAAAYVAGLCEAQADHPRAGSPGCRDGDHRGQAATGEGVASAACSCAVLAQKGHAVKSVKQHLLDRSSLEVLRGACCRGDFFLTTKAPDT